MGFSEGCDVFPYSSIRQHGTWLHLYAEEMFSSQMLLFSQNQENKRRKEKGRKEKKKLQQLIYFDVLRSSNMKKENRK